MPTDTCEILSLSTQLVCSNILLNLAWLYIKCIYTTDLNTLLQVLIKNKANYLKIKAGLFQVSSKVFHTRHFIETGRQKI